MPQVPNSERENNIFSYGIFRFLYPNFPYKTYIICLLLKECQLTISGIVNCSVWFVDIYDPAKTYIPGNFD